MPGHIPHSVFLGRIVRPGQDPEWTELDRGYALAWQANKRATCSGCGTRADEWPSEDEDAFVPASMTCRGCAQLGDQRANLAKDAAGNRLPGQYVYLEPLAVFQARMKALHAQPPPDEDD